MNQFLAQQKIELLDRKYEFLINNNSKTFFFDLVNFIEFLNQDEVIKDFTEKIEISFEEKQKFYERTIDGKFNEAIKILRGSNINKNFTDEDAIGWVNNKIQNIKLYQVTINIRSDLEDEISHHQNAIYPVCNQPEFHNNGDVEIDKTIKEIKFAYKLWKTFSIISAGRALKILKNIVSYVNFKEITLEEEEILRERGQEHISTGSHLSNNSNLNYLDFDNYDIEKVRLVKNKIQIVYEAIRQEIGSTRLRLQILDKYKIRSQWYNREYLRSLPEKRNIEEPLTRDLALYLFEQGITVWYRVKAGQHEYDLIHPETNYPFLTEVKAYKNSSTARREIMKGFRQIHSYLSTYESHIPSCEGYLVVYRLGSAIYELPAKISTQRFTIYPMLIDIADSSESGSRQPKPIQITEQEILKELGKSSEEKQS